MIKVDNTSILEQKLKNLIGLPPRHKRENAHKHPNSTVNDKSGLNLLAKSEKN